MDGLVPQAQQKNLHARGFAAERQPPRRGEVKRTGPPPHFDQHRAEPRAARALQRRLQSFRLSACAHDNVIGRTEPIFVHPGPIGPTSFQAAQAQADQQPGPARGHLLRRP